MTLLRDTIQRLLTILVCLVIAASVADRVVAAPAAAGPTHVQLVLDLKGFSGPVRDLAFSPNGTMLAASGQQEVRIWDVRTGRLLRTVRGEIGPQGYGDCLAVAFSHDNCELVVGIRGRQGQGALRVYDVRNIAELKELIPGVPGRSRSWPSRARGVSWPWAAKAASW